MAINTKRVVRRRRLSRGFSMVEVMTAMMIITVGIVSMLALFSISISTMQSTQEDLICKQKAKEAMESIYTARESGQVTFDNINNTSTTPGIFLTGFRNLTGAGSDGLVGTSDDGAIETMVLPGPDGMLGTSDDQIISLSNYQRQISITPLLNGSVVNPDIRNLQVTIQFTNQKGQVRTYTVSSLISRYR